MLSLVYSNNNYQVSHYYSNRLSGESNRLRDNLDENEQPLPSSLCLPLPLPPPPPPSSECLNHCYPPIRVPTAITTKLQRHTKTKKKIKRAPAVFGDIFVAGVPLPPQMAL